MKYFVVLLTVLLPSFIFADGNVIMTNNTLTIFKTQNIIDSRDFLQKDGLEKMRAVSSNLPDESRIVLYEQNRKNGSLSWLNCLVPSLGSWIIGDKRGAIVGVIGGASGYILALGVAPIIAYSGPGDHSVALNVTMIAADLILLGSVTFSIFSAYSYTDDYNNKLKTGLGMVSMNSEEELNNRMMAKVLNLPKVNELFHINLFSYNF